MHNSNLPKLDAFLKPSRLDSVTASTTSVCNVDDNGCGVIEKSDLEATATTSMPYCSSSTEPTLSTTDEPAISLHPQGLELNVPSGATAAMVLRRSL